MPVVDALFNGLVALADAVAVFLAARSPGRRSVAFGLISAVFAGTLLAAWLQRDSFHLIRLYAFLFFLHLPLLLLIGAGILSGTARRSALLLAVAAVLLLGLAADAFLIEPRWIEVTRVRIESVKLDRPVRVAVVADLQTDRIGAYERRTLQRVMRERPDLVLLTGDYIQESDPDLRAAQGAELRTLLLRIGFGAPLGVYAVRGNVERNDWIAMFAGTPVTPMERTARLDLGVLRLTGLALGDSFDPFLQIGASDRFEVLFGHAPDFALGSVRADLLVAGHTHGGQVRLPFLGPLIRFSRVPAPWAAGVTRLDDGGVLVVSRGIGMERTNAPRLRILCRPEIVFIDCVPAAE